MRDLLALMLLLGRVAGLARLPRGRALRAAATAAEAPAAAGIEPGGDARAFLAEATAQALAREFGPEFGTEAFAAVRPATKREFGDFQCNASARAESTRRLVGA